ncbi:MAG: hypothetical protein ACLFR0_09435 [Alphaproteobacteria bacterium]
MANEAKNTGVKDSQNESKNEANNASDNGQNAATTDVANENKSVFSRYKETKGARKDEVMSLDAWSQLCHDPDSLAYANFSDRLLKALGEPEIVDTSKSNQQERLVYGDEKIARYEPFKDLYDAESVISQIANYLQNGGNGMLVLRGPVGSGKTEIATILEKLAETQPMYLLKCKKTHKVSPFNDTPLALLANDEMKDVATQELGIPERYLKNVVPSAWVTKRLDYANGDPNEAFEVAKVYPSRDKQMGIFKMDPKDKKIADINSLIGKVDMTKVGDEDPLDPEGEATMSAGDPDAYIPGALSRSHGGVFHLGEGFRNNSAVMNTFLEGVTTGYFAGTDGVGTLPMDQLVIITSNDPVWKEFKAGNDSDAARNRIEVVDVPYTLRMSEELKIYEKLLKKSRFEDKKKAPGTLDLLAEFSVVTRLMDGKDNALEPYDKFIRAKVHNGEVPDGVKVPKLHELRAKASPEEGLYGFTLRDAERVMLRTFNARANEGIVEADTILLLETLRDFVNKANEEDISAEEKTEYLGYINTLQKRNREDLDKKINAAIVDADDATCQRMFDEYIHYAEAWVNETEIKSPIGEPINRAKIEDYLNKFEKRAGIQHGAEFRKSAVNSINSEIARKVKSNQGKPADQQDDLIVRWDSYEPIAKAIRKQHEIDHDSRVHILKAKSETDLRSDEEKRQYSRFHENMQEQGYSETMVARMLDHLSYS